MAHPISSAARWARRRQGNTWPVTAEGWLPATWADLCIARRRSQPDVARKFSVVRAGSIAYMSRHGVAQTPRQTADRPSSAPLASRGARIHGRNTAVAFTDRRFHSHFVGPDFPLTTLERLPAAQRPVWEGINGRLADPGALIASLEAGGIAARIISTPPEFIEDADGNVPADTYPRINDAIADLASRHPHRLYGLATVDAFGGDRGAREVDRAVNDLGLRGIFMPSAKDDLLPNAAEARPTLATAAALGVPVFLHPVEDAQLFARFKPFGRLGVRLTRGTINSAALFAMMESGVFEDCPNLRVVVTALALGGLLLAGTVGDGGKLHAGTSPLARRHVYVDTTGVHPAIIRSAVDLLDADHVLMGTDWPVVVEEAVGSRLQATLTAVGLKAQEQKMISGGNALRLLGVE